MTTGLIILGFFIGVILGAFIVRAWHKLSDTLLRRRIAKDLSRQENLFALDELNRNEDMATLDLRQAATAEAEERFAIGIR